MLVYRRGSSIFLPLCSLFYSIYMSQIIVDLIYSLFPSFSICKWIGLRENPQEAIDFLIKLLILDFPVNFPLNQSIESLVFFHLFEINAIDFFHSRPFQLTMVTWPTAGGRRRGEPGWWGSPCWGTGEAIGVTNSCHQRSIRGYTWGYHMYLANCPITVERSTILSIFLMGKSTISMAMCNSYVKLPACITHNSGWLLDHWNNVGNPMPQLPWLGMVEIHPYKWWFGGVLLLGLPHYTASEKW